MPPKRSRLSHAALLGMLTAAGTFYFAPRMFRKAFAPPQRDASQSPSGLGLPQEQVWLRSVTGTRLHGWFIPVVGPAPVVVVLHGWGGNASLMLPLAPHLNAAGFHALFLDARNHGHSEHDTFVSMPRFAEDLEIAVDWVAGREEVTSIGVLGHSVGAGAAILSASRSDHYSAVVSVSSFSHPEEMMREQMDRIPTPILNAILESVQRTIGYRFETFAPRVRLPQVTAPLLLVHGDSDPVVPITDLYELSAIRPDAEVLIVEDGGHSDLAPFEPYVAQITDFLARHLT
ncbi:MAG: alpha/beta hydrolase [bacterium]|nr:alpha/beta hydrolase [bacterium]MCP4964055.1 alpha/beta hydrolase [bacterium]